MHITRPLGQCVCRGPLQSYCWHNYSLSDCVTAAAGADFDVIFARPRYDDVPIIWQLPIPQTASALSWQERAR